jgi:hypothetical protein
LSLIALQDSFNKPRQPVKHQFVDDLESAESSRDAFNFFSRRRDEVRI